MDFPSSVISQLDTLSEALDDMGDDLHAVLAVLADDLRSVIPSFLGLSITVRMEDQPVTVTAIDSPTAGASMLLPLAAISDLPTNGTLVFYAANPGAFVDLAADARAAYGLDGQVVLDRHLPIRAGSRSRGEQGLLERCQINQAIGVLIDQGYPPDRARAELDRRSAAAGIDPHTAAQSLLWGIPVPANVAEGQDVRALDQ